MGFFQKRMAAFSYAFKGIYILFRNETHAKIHLCAALLVIAAGIIWRISPTEWCLVSICIGAVFSAEGFNTSIEKLADKITTEKSSLIGTAKDLAAGAVLLSALASVAVGLIIFIPKICR